MILAEPNPSSADSLFSTNDPDDMANEQTWPTEEEMNGADRTIDQPTLPAASAGTTPKVVRRIPKGMSEYQASWIIDEEDEDDVDGDEEDEKDREAMEEVEEEMQDLVMDEDQDTGTVDTRSVMFQDLDEDDEKEQ